MRKPFDFTYASTLDLTLKSPESTAESTPRATKEIRYPNVVRGNSDVAPALEIYCIDAPGGTEALSSRNNRMCWNYLLEC